VGGVRGVRGDNSERLVDEGSLGVCTAASATEARTVEKNSTLVTIGCTDEIVLC
jgi:hypothetical protein